MNISEVLKYMVDVIRVGHQLTHVEDWKNAQAVTNALVAVSGIALSVGHPILVDHDVLAGLGATIASVASVYLTYATSSKVGIK